MMKRNLLSILFLIFIFSPVILSAGTKHSIAVLELNLINVREDIGLIIRNKIEFSLYKSGKFNILERNRFDILKKENRLSEKNIDSREYAIEAGRILPAEYVVTGSVTFRGRYFIHVTLVDVKSGTIIYTFDEDYESEDMIYNESDEIERGVQKTIYDSVPEEKADIPLSTHYYLSVHSGYIPPAGRAEDFSDGGFIIDSEFGIKNIFIDHLNAGVSAGYSHFFTDREINYASIIPLLVTSSYSFEISIIKILPGFGAGSAYITIDKNSGSKSAFEPCVSLYIKGDIMLTGNIGLEISSNYYTIYEPDGNIDFFSCNAGLVSFL